MDTDKLINDLAKEGKPVKRLRSPSRRFVIWLMLSMASLGIGLFIAGLRKDCGEMMWCVGFMWQTAVIFALGALSGYLAFILSVPGREPKRALQWSVILLAAASVTTLVLLAGTTAGCKVGCGWTCSLQVAAFGAFPAVLLIYMLTRAAPLKCAVCGVLAGLATVSMGAAAMQFVCGSNDPLHLLVWHYVPGFLFVFIGIAIANRLLKV